jgi:hypothetical protein
MYGAWPILKWKNGKMEKWKNGTVTDSCFTIGD